MCFVTSPATVIAGCCTEVGEGLENFNSFLLAVDDTDDPMEMKVKRHHSEENVLQAKVARMTEQKEVPSGMSPREPKNGKRGEPEAS